MWVVLGMFGASRQDRRFHHGSHVHRLSRCGQQRIRVVSWRETAISGALGESRLESIALSVVATARPNESLVWLPYCKATLDF